MRKFHEEAAEVHHPQLDFFNWPVLGVAWGAWLSGLLPTLWDHLPGPTALYMVVSAAFMLFQMADKLGFLDRFKRRKLTDVPDQPEEH